MNAGPKALFCQACSRSEGCDCVMVPIMRHTIPEGHEPTGEYRTAFEGDLIPHLVKGKWIAFEVEGPTKTQQLILRKKQPRRWIVEEDNSSRVYPERGTIYPGSDLVNVRIIEEYFPEVGKEAK